MTPRIIRSVLVTCAIVAAAAAAGAQGVDRPPSGAVRPRMLMAPPGTHIGISARDIDAATAERLKISGGAFVDSVQPGAPAERAGFRAGDVVVEFDGEHIRSARQLSRVVEETAPDKKVRVTVLRDGKKTELSVAPAATNLLDPLTDGRLRDRLREFEDRMPPALGFDLSGPRARLGVTVIDITPQLGDHLGAKQGVLVTDVAENSAAARAGVKAGDVITKADDQTVRSRQDLLRAVREVHDAGELSLGIVRDKKDTTLKVRLEAPPRASTRPPYRGV
jgi:serine protease Do